MDFTNALVTLKKQKGGIMLQIKSGQKVIFIGDSITDCGRREAQFPFGGGYVKLLIDLVTAKYPERKIEFYNKGISGNTVIDLEARWYDDMTKLRPDWLFVKIGINDLHRTLRMDMVPVPPEKFRQIYDKLLKETRAKIDPKIVLIDPFYMSTDFNSGSSRSEVLKLLPAYLEVVKGLAKKYNALHVELHKAFQQQLKYRQADNFCPEPVHPYLNGHIVIAHEILKKIGW